MLLLERHTQLAELEAARRDASVGRGSVVLVAGDAGTGKTALVQEFASGLAKSARLLWGMCDDLLLPRPLGPFRDMFPTLGGDHAQVSAGALRGDQGWLSGFFDRIVDELNRPPRPAVVIVEDAQWGDAATLDAIRFLGRRINRMSVLLVVTYRNDEVAADHPLRLAVGAIPAGEIRRIRLEPLSPDAVARLAGYSDVAALYQLTDGNPFYVREMLAHPRTGHVPLTVQDAVLARTRRLPPTGYACVELASVVPGRVERWVFTAGGDAQGLDQALRLGVLRADGDAVRFPHELTRQAVEQSLSEPRRRELNERVLKLLESGKADSTRLVHHAFQAGDRRAVARYAPVAAESAAGVSSHREAVGHLEHALAYPDEFSPEQLANLLEAYGRECELAGVHDRAHSALERAVTLRESMGDHVGLGRSLSRLSSLEWALGLGPQARRSARRAVAVLETQPRSRDLVAAYAQVARLAMTGYRCDESIVWAERAIELARQVGDPRAATHAEVTVGVARMLRDRDMTSLVGALGNALARGDYYAAGRAYVNLASGHVRDLEYEDAVGYIDDGLAHCERHGLITSYDFLAAIRALFRFERGHWSLAEQDAQRCAPVASDAAAKLTALRVMALIQARRRDPRAATTFERVGELVSTIDEVPSRVHGCLVRAELAWLDARPDELRRATEGVLELAQSTGTARLIGEAAYWMYRAGRLDTVPDGVPEPYALQIGGQWREAARRWSDLGRPYEEADALSDAPEPGAQLEALEIFDRFGAVARAAMVRRTLTRMGVTSIPRGPREATKTSPAGLTARQTEVLTLLAENLTYQQIADRLQLSPKTVDHHVAAVRLKLDVSNRDDAVLAGVRLGILAPENGE